MMYPTDFGGWSYRVTLLFRVSVSPEFFSKTDHRLPKIGVFGQFLQFKSLDFSSTAYYDRQARYVADVLVVLWLKKNFLA